MRFSSCRVLLSLILPLDLGYENSLEKIRFKIDHKKKKNENSQNVK